jgi:hypothetical protein
LVPIQQCKSLLFDKHSPPNPFPRLHLQDILSGFQVLDWYGRRFRRSGRAAFGPKPALEIIDKPFSRRAFEREPAACRDKVSRIAGAALLRHRLAGKYPTRKNA